MDFIVLDVETANADYASICEIGWARVSSGVVTETCGTLVNPQSHFDWMNISLHGISPEDVKTAPTFQQIWPILEQTFEDRIIASHGPFDRVAVQRARSRHHFEPNQRRWLDVIRVIRRVWPETFARSGYGLSNACASLGIPLQDHHRAEADAHASALILLKALNAAGWSAEDAIEHSHARMSAVKAYPDRKAYLGNPSQDGSLSGHTIVFTGTLSVPRHDAALLARSLGAEVAPSVTKHTTLLVVGDGDVVERPLSEKTAKHKKAEALVETGKSKIRLISETDFIALAALERLEDP